MSLDTIGNPQLELQEKGVIDSGCSRYMTGNKSYLSDYEEINGGFVAFGGDPKGGTKKNIDAGQDGKKIVPDQEYILLPLLTSNPSLSKSLKDSLDARFKPLEEPRVNQEQDANVNNTNNNNIVSPIVNADDIENNAADENIVYGCDDDLNMPNLEDIVYSDDDE
ncbi:hypothetical protein Tco_0147041, partial [Tanacetum coccineum]